MYCTNCGKEVDDKAVICVNCGVPIKGRYEQAMQSQTQPRHTQEQKQAVKSVFSLIGFIFSMVSLLLGILLPIPAVGLALSVVGYCQSKAKKESDSFGIAGMIVGSVLFVFWVIIWIVIVTAP